MEITQQGDAQRLWKTETASALPGLTGIGNGTTRYKTDHRLAHCELLYLGTNGATIVYPKWGTWQGEHVTLAYEHLMSAKRWFVEPGVRMYAYATVLAVSTALLFLGLLAAGYTLGNAWVVIALAVVAAVAEQASVRLSSRADIRASIAALPALFAAVLYGPLAAMVVAGASMVGDFKNASPQPR